MAVRKDPGRSGGSDESRPGIILAAADAAENKGPPPPELSLAWSCSQWDTLPEPGGRRDQRAGEIERMTVAKNTYDAMSAHRRATNWVEWAKQNPGAQAIVGQVRRLRRGS